MLICLLMMWMFEFPTPMLWVGIKNLFNQSGSGSWYPHDEDVLFRRGSRLRFTLVLGVVETLDDAVDFLSKLLGVKLSASDFFAFMASSIAASY